MNITSFEIKRNFKFTIIFTFWLVLLVFGFLKGMYPLYADSKAQVLQVIQNYPSEFLKLFGFDMDTMFSPLGFYSFTFNYSALLSTTFVSLLTFRIIANEKKENCLAFLFTKPVTKKAQFLYKLLSVFSLVLFSQICYIGCLWYLLPQDFLSLQAYLLTLLSLLLCSCLVIAFTCVLAIILPSLTSYTGLSIAIGFGGFILHAMVSMIDKPFIKYLSFFDIFHPSYLLNHTNFQISTAVYTCIFLCLCMALSLYFYQRQKVE